MKNLFIRDIKAGIKAGSAIGTSLLFFLSVILLSPFALGTEKTMLIKAGPGLLWFFALLAVLLGLDRLFQTDKEDGSLDIILAAGDFSSLTVMILVKSAAHWVSTVLPLIAAAPVLSLLLNPDWRQAAALTASLALGTPAITFIGALGAALTAALPRGGVLLAVLVLPLIIPVIIFGIAASAALVAGTALQPLYFLLALTLFFGLIGPAAAALALKFTAE